MATMMNVLQGAGPTGQTVNWVQTLMSLLQGAGGMMSGLGGIGGGMGGKAEPNLPGPAAPGGLPPGVTQTQHYQQMGPFLPQPAGSVGMSRNQLLEALIAQAMGPWRGGPYA